MPPRRILSRPLVFLLTAALAMLMSPVVAGRQASGAIPSYTMEERATAIASPSMMYVESFVSGFLRRTDTGQALTTNAMVLNYRCSGFVVSQEGHVITSSHCLQPGKVSYRGTAANVLAADRVKAGELTADQRDAFVRDTVANTEFTGDNLVSAPSVKVFGQLYKGQAALMTDPAVPGQIVEALHYNEGDVTLLKFGLTGMPVVEIAPESIAPNASVVPMGFSNTANSTIYTVKSQPAKATNRHGDTAPPVFRMDGDLGPVSRGGAVTDSGGRFVGMITADTAAKDRPNVLIANAEHIKKILGNAGAANSLSRTDQAYRAGLDAYFGGRYTEAIEKLDTVIAVMPDHVVAGNYRRQATERRVIEGEPSPFLSAQGLMIVIGALGLALLACFVAILWLIIRSRRRQRHAMIDPYAAPISALPVSAHPISAIPISGEPGGGYHTYLPLPPPQPLPSQPENPDQPFSFGPAGTEYEGPAAGAGEDGRNPWGPPAR